MQIRQEYRINFNGTLIALVCGELINLEESPMKSVRLIKQSERQLSAAFQQNSADRSNYPANAFSTVRNWIKERDNTTRISPHAAFEKLFATGNITSSVKAA